MYLTVSYIHVVFKLMHKHFMFGSYLSLGGPWGVCVCAIENLSTAVTLVSLVQCQKYYDFLKAETDTFQMMCFNPKFGWSPNLSFFGLGSWAIIHGIAELGNIFIAQI